MADQNVVEGQDKNWQNREIRTLIRNYYKLGCPIEMNTVIGKALQYALRLYIRLA